MTLSAVAFIRNQALHCLCPYSHMTMKHQLTKTCLFARTVCQVLYLTSENKLLNIFQGKPTIHFAQSST